MYVDIGTLGDPCRLETTQVMTEKENKARTKNHKILAVLVVCDGLLGTTHLLWHICTFKFLFRGCFVYVLCLCWPPLFRKPTIKQQPWRVPVRFVRAQRHGGCYQSACVFNV
jgi:hypothetical protein